MPSLIMLTLAATLVGCGDKAPPASSGDAAAANAKKVEITADLPDSAEARAFAERLIALEVTNFKPTDDNIFKYDALRFSPDGSWRADAHLEAGGETIRCTESGTWSIEAAASASAAFMQWSTDDTDCAGRESGTSQRVQMLIEEDATYEIAFR